MAKQYEWYLIEGCEAGDDVAFEDELTTTQNFYHDNKELAATLKKDGAYLILKIYWLDKDGNQYGPEVEEAEVSLSTFELPTHGEYGTKVPRKFHRQLARLKKAITAELPAYFA